MALRLLAGPFPMKTLAGEYARFFNKPMWFDSLMALAGVIYCSLPGGDLVQGGSLVQIDGAVCWRNPYASNYANYAHDLEGTGIAHLNTYAGGAAYRNVNPITLNPEQAAIATDPYLVTGAYFLQDRILFGTQMRSRPYGASDNGAIETPLPAPALDFGGLGASYCPGPAPGQVFFTGRNGALLYDHVNRKYIGWRRQLGFVAKWPMLYSPALGVWFVIQEAVSPQVHHTISVYADEPVPTSLSAPVALAPVGQGGAVEYRSRLLGANNEPCAGVLVDWTCTTPGILQVAQSTTDADGYARTRVALPIGSTGQNFDLTAQVVL